jgi:hypothetical protein
MKKLKSSKMSCYGLCLFMMALLLCMTPLVASAATTIVTTPSDSFSPADITINVGDVVQWNVNQAADGPHTVTGDPTGNANGGVGADSTCPQQTLNSPFMSQGATYSSQPFTAPGLCAYICQVHYVSTTMKGTITVNGTATTTVATTTTTRPTTTTTVATTTTLATTTTTVVTTTTTGATTTTTVATTTTTRPTTTTTVAGTTTTVATTTTTIVATTTTSTSTTTTTLKCKDKGKGKDKGKHKGCKKDKDKDDDQDK